VLPYLALLSQCFTDITLVLDLTHLIQVSSRNLKI
jgi:hypothetical protein